MGGDGEGILGIRSAFEAQAALDQIDGPPRGHAYAALRGDLDKRAVVERDGKRLLRSGGDLVGVPDVLPGLVGARGRRDSSRAVRRSLGAGGDLPEYQGDNADDRRVREGDPVQLTFRSARGNLVSDPPTPVTLISDSPYRSLRAR